jgi:hypothetical protein
MANLKEYYFTDFSHSVLLNRSWHFTTDSTTEKLEVLGKVGLDKYSDAKYLVFYIPPCISSFQVCKKLLEMRNGILLEVNNVEIQGKFISDISLGNFGSKFSIFSNKIYFYVEDIVIVGNIG